MRYTSSSKWKADSKMWTFTIKLVCCVEIFDSCLVVLFIMIMTSVSPLREIGSRIRNINLSVACFSQISCVCAYRVTGIVDGNTTDDCGIVVSGHEILYCRPPDIVAIFQSLWNIYAICTAFNLWIKYSRGKVLPPACPRLWVCGTNRRSCSQ